MKEMVHAIRQRLTVLSGTIENDELQSEERTVKCLAEIRTIDRLLSRIDVELAIDRKKRK